MLFQDLSKQVIGCAIEVHRQLGPGLLESTYEKCLGFELHSIGIQFVSQKPLPVEYKGMLIECGYRIDLMIEGLLLVELKSVEQIIPIHEAQILTYMKLAKTQAGLLMNFNVGKLTNGIRRFVLSRTPPCSPRPPR